MSDSTQDIEWGAPPPKSKAVGTYSPYDYFYDALRDKPGVWAKYPGASGSASQWAKGRTGYEVTQRTMTDSEGEKYQQAWMRFVGGPNDG